MSAAAPAVVPAVSSAASETPAISPFTLEEYVSLFNYDGPSSPEIYSSDLVTLVAAS